MKNKKLKKLLTKPNLFFRDYLNKKYPEKNIEQPFFEQEESFVVALEKRLNKIEQNNTGNLSFNIDVVFTWVNDKDPVWKNKLHTHLQQNQYPTNATDNARFENRDELRYSVHSVLKYMPWVHHIYIVTDNQIPDWLQNFHHHNKITIIDHRDIIENQYLPTFNSHVIEANLHKIPGLSEHFIYFNDDVFVAQTLHQSHFFHTNRIASLFISDKSIREMENRGVTTPTLIASKNSISLLKQHYQVDIDTPLVHTYVPLKKSSYEKCYALFQADIESFFNNKFRGNNDLNLATFLVPWIMYLESQAVPNTETCYYFNIRSNRAKTFYQKLLNKKNTQFLPHSFCANDFKSDTTNQDYETQLIHFLSSYYRLKK